MRNSLLPDRDYRSPRFCCRIFTITTFAHEINCRFLRNHMVWWMQEENVEFRVEKSMFIFAAILFVILSVGVTGVFTMMDQCM